MIDYDKLLLTLRAKYVDVNGEWAKLIDFTEAAADKYEKDGDTKDMVKVAYWLLEHYDILDELNEKYLTFHQLAESANGGEEIQWN